ncbi:hypothetical protein [Nonomuraea typhae]|uniref:MftR C-terminal domain-containing protein n=1 Tax=Nonomuraea typhae TaxID=2603600 RepID=A0ABW7YR76_9ACTN
MIASERYERAALLGVAIAEEMRRLLRLHLRPAEVAADGTVGLEVPFPDAVVVCAVLDVAAECFGEEGTAEQARQAALETLLQLADFHTGSPLNR